MGLFERIFRPGASKEREAAKNAGLYFKMLNGYQPVFTSWRGSIYESLLVRAAIDARARHFSKLKFEVFGTARPSLQSKLKAGPNQWQSYSQFLYLVSSIVDVYGTCFIVPVYDADLNTTGYYPVIPERVTIVEYRDALYLKYKFHRGDVAAVPLHDCAIITAHQLKNEFFGETNEPLKETMDLIHLQAQAIKEAVKNGASFRFMARLNNYASDEDLALEQSRFNRTSLQGESGGVLLFPNIYSDIKQLSAANYVVDKDQMELINTNIMNYYGTNLDVIQSKAYGDAWAAYYESAIEPLAIQFSESMTRAIFSENERARGSYVMLTSNRLQYLSNGDKLKVSAQMADRGLMTINEIREIWNLPPIEGGDRATIRGEYYFTDDEKETETEAEE